MSVLLDSGAFLALERNDPEMWRRLKRAFVGGAAPLTHGGIVGQVWRGLGPRQALLARALEMCDVRPLDVGLGKGAGELMKKARTKDVVDAALVALAHDHDRVITSDPDDIDALIRASGRDIEVVPV